MKYGAECVVSITTGPVLWNLLRTPNGHKERYFPVNIDSCGIYVSPNGRARHEQHFTRVPQLPLTVTFSVPS